MAKETMSALEKRVRCTFEECELTFPSEKAMIRHKIADQDHEYCIRCKEDFSSEESHLVHKIQSSDHIVCHICGIEFKSEGGRDRHIVQIHRNDQDITCVGCQTKFVRAAPLITHLESGDCPGISTHEYKKMRVHKQAVKTIIGQALGTTTNPQFITGGAVNGSVASEHDGGVRVNLLDDADDFVDATNQNGGDRSDMSLYEDPPEEEALSGGLEGMKLSGSRRACGTLSELDNVRSPEDRRNTENKGKDKENKPTGQLYSSGIDLGDLLDFSETHSVHENVQSGQDKDDRNGENDDVDGSPNYSADWAKWGVSHVPRDQGETEVKTGGYLWDKERFFNHLLGKYACACDQTFATAEELESHINSGVHSAGVARCPGCLRIFKSHPALVAHVESATKRCRVARSDNIGQVMDEISGGVLEAVGHYQDNSVKYGGAIRTGQKKQAPAIDLDKVDW